MTGILLEWFGVRIDSSEIVKLRDRSNRQIGLEDIQAEKSREAHIFRKRGLSAGTNISVEVVELSKGPVAQIIVAKATGTQGEHGARPGLVRETTVSSLEYCTLRRPESNIDAELLIGGRAVYPAGAELNYGYTA